MSSSRHLALLLLGALAASPLAAQGRHTPGQTAGVLGGLANASLVVQGEESDFTFDARRGVALGFSLYRTGTTALGIEIDVMYLRKGFRTEGDGATAALAMGYLELPVLLRYALGDGRLRPYLLAGGSVAARLSCSGEFADGEGTSFEADCTPGTAKTLDYGLMGGAGVSRDRFSLTARYGLGLANVLDNGSDVTSKTRTLLVLVGYRL